MNEHPIDLDMLAMYLQTKIEERRISIRTAAIEMNLGAATLSRLLKGAATKNQPDSVNLKKAIDWLGRPLSDFEPGRAPASTTWADVELHFRALPDLDEDDVETLVAMAKAGYEKVRELRQSKKTQG